jgi:hypothetical protein
MSDAIVEAAARALQMEDYNYHDPEDATRLATAVLAAVAPLIEAAALERAAEVAEVVPIIAARIRALISPSQSPSADSA